MCMNSFLFSRLESLFGKVKIANEGEKACQHKRSFGRAPFSMDVTGGEEYRVCCPFCHDDNFHLYIHYLYGTVGKDGRPVLLAHCFKRCLEDPDNRRKLSEMILSSGPIHYETPKDHLELKEVFPELQKIKLPMSLSMSNLPDSHVAVKYLESRGFSREIQNKYYLHFSPCIERIEKMLRNRIIIPIFFDKRLVGWQARTIEEGKKPKYYTMPGLRKSGLLYNLDNAVNAPYIVITEGVTDAWKVGDGAVSLLGKTLSREQGRILKERCKGKPIFILLDPDAFDDAMAIAKSLKGHQGPVKVIRLQKYSDPGEAPADYLKRIIKKEARLVQSSVH